MKHYVFLLIDLDDTILDFAAAEKVAYGKALAEFGIPETPELLARYHVINISWWEKLERGETDRDTLLVARQAELFREFGIDRDPAAFEAAYRRNLGVGHWFMPGAEALLADLRAKGYRLFLASNGVRETQYSRLESAGIGPLFERVFISEDAGYSKPDKAYFDWCFAQIPDFDPEKALILGDSLTSDIRGGINAGIDTCWYNPRGKEAPEALRPTFVISSLEELKTLL